MNYSSDLQSLWAEVKNYLELQKQYLMMDTAEKLTVLLSAVAIAAVFLILGVVMLFFFVIAFGISSRVYPRAIFAATFAIG